MRILSQSMEETMDAKRSAFTMIELIFSIVIVGIVILSIPLIVRQSSANTIMSQNVIGYYNALTLMETIKSKPWDRSSISDFNASGVYYILNTGNNDTDCKPSTVNFQVTERQDDGTEITVTKQAVQINTKRGLANANKRRMCDPNNKNASAISANNNLESINDFQDYEKKVIGKVSDGNEIFTLKTNIKYAGINFGNGTQAGSITGARRATDDIKTINITLERINPNGTSEAIATFTYHAANIGTDIPLIKDNVVVNP